MGLATLYNVPTDINTMNVFSFNNSAEHAKIASALISQYNVTPPWFVIDPIPITDQGVWLEQHQLLHTIMDTTIGASSNDLTEVDLNDPSQLSEWIWLHAQEHYYAAQILGLT